MSTRYQTKARPKKKAEPSPDLTTALRKKREDGSAIRFRARQSVSSSDMERLVHELETHQMELEVQNEELRRTQEELSASRRKYQDLFEFGPAGYFTLNSAGLITEVNNTAARILGLDKRFLMKRPFSVFVKAGQREIFRSHLRETLRSGAGQSCTVSLRRQDGFVFEALLQSVPSGKTKARHVLCRTAVTDITKQRAREKELDAYRDRLRSLVAERTSELARSNRELHDRVAELRIAREALSRSEQLFRSLIENSSDVVLLIERNGVLLYVSDSARKVLGYEPRELFAKNTLDFIHPEDRERIAMAVPDTRNPALTEIHTCRVRHKDGSWHFIEGVVKRLSGPSGEMIINARDVTERVEMERRLRELVLHQQAVREEERMRISREIHDHLGQMLTALFLELSLLRSRHLDAGGPSLRKTVEEMSHTLEETIESVHRICADLRPSVLDNLGLREAIRWQVGEFGKKAHIRTFVDLPAGQLRLADHISTNIFRILQEVLTNVVRHAAATEVKIRVKMDDGMVVMTVRDNGRGIMKRDLMGTSSFGIMGMQERAARLGGEINIKGIRSRGTTVTLRIPVAQDVEKQ